MAHHETARLARNLFILLPLVAYGCSEYGFDDKPADVELVGDGPEVVTGGDVNVDVDGDGVADVNIDTDGDGEADVNLDPDGDGVPNVNIDVDGDGEPDVNIDNDGDGTADYDIDLDGDGTPDIAIDTNGDGIPDITVEIPIPDPEQPEDPDPVDPTDPVDPEPEEEEDGGNQQFDPDDTATWGICDWAANVAGYLDQYQTPDDGQVTYCHSSSGGNFVLNNSDINSCLTHIGHNYDVFPTTLCDS